MPFAGHRLTLSEISLSPEEASLTLPLGSPPANSFAATLADGTVTPVEPQLPARSRKPLLLLSFLAGALAIALVVVVGTRSASPMEAPSSASPQIPVSPVSEPSATSVGSPAPSVVEPPAASVSAPPATSSAPAKSAPAPRSEKATPKLRPRPKTRPKTRPKVRLERSNPYQ